MSRQDKATTEKFTRTLRELVKLPENKVCADCKRNDPRWASWNIGVFLCIRCSGIHRGMGTHISKVKSVDLDTWTPEQMESIQKWGNYLANLYWEAHLKPGHIPPEHKMESFIRSKYESRRWALEGPPPTDPSALATTNGAQAQAQAPPAAQPQQVQQQPQQKTTARTRTAATTTTRQPQTHQLLSTNYTNRGQPSSATTIAPVPVAPAPAPAVPAPQNDLFSLDFHTPASTTSTPVAEGPKKDVKHDILSLFSAPPPTTAPPNAFGQFGAAVSPWATQPQQQPQQPTSMLGTAGVGAWGASSGWGGAPAAPAQSNLWSTNPTTNVTPIHPQQTSLFNTTAVWGATATPASTDSFGLFAGASGNGLGAAVQSKKDDVFGDLWGGFK